MKVLDCAIFYEWEYDDDFVSILTSELESKKLTAEVYGPDDFDGLAEKLNRKAISFRTVIDRASERR